MNLDDLIRRVAGASASPYERLSGKFRPVEGGAIAKRRDKWSQRVARGDEELFARRLAMEGFTADDIPRLVGDVEWVGSELPRWTSTLRACMAAAADCEFVEADSDPVAFEEIFAPFISVADEQLGPLPMFAPAARQAFLRALLRRLSLIAGPALELEFSIFRSTKGETSVRRPESKFNRVMYDAFVRSVHRDRFVSLFTHYPVLSRLMSQAVDFWIEGTSALAERLERDRAAIEEMFSGHQPPGAVVEVTPELSDFHNGHRTVAILRFESGLSMVYKPRPVALERAWGELLRWLNGQEPAIDLQPLRVLDRGEYGWVEFAESRPCSSDDEIRRLFTRAGMLLFLVRLLEGTDCHFENIVTTGEHPHLIDCEALLHARATPEVESAAGAMKSAMDVIGRSVIRTGFLPNFAGGASDLAIDQGGLNLGFGEEMLIPHVHWVQVNTDFMSRVYRPAPRRLGRPKAESQPAEKIDPTAYEQEILGGYRIAHDALTRCKALLRRDRPPLASFGAAQSRFVLRNTATYQMLMYESLEPNRLADGVERFIVFESLRRPTVARTAASSMMPAYREESDALLQLDVPYFEVPGSSRDLHTRTRRIATAIFEAAAIDRVIENVDALSDEDAIMQERLIRAALDGRRAGSAIALAAESEHFQSAPIDSAVLLSEAVRIADDLVATALRAQDGSLTWMALQPVGSKGHHQIGVGDSTLYGGSGGVALFLAALFRVTEREQYADAARAALRTVQASVRDRSALRSASLGGFTGAASVLYATVQAGRLLDDRSLIESAVDAVMMLEEKSILDHEVVDVINGIAGLILVLLGIDDVKTNGRAVDLAAVCGRQLLDRRVATPSGFRSWQTLEPFAPLTGFSHGAAGIAHALGRLHDATGVSEFGDAAAEGFAYEATQFDSEAANWRDLRAGEGQQTLMSAWCHGAAGIVLQRAAGKASLDDSEWSRVEHALASPRNFGMAPDDHLCCGNCGRAMILLDVGRRLGREDLIARARSLLASVVARARAREGRYATKPATTTGLTPGLMTGTAGVGYALLHAAAPDVVPSALLLE